MNFKIDSLHGTLVCVEKEKAFELFPNWTIFWFENGELQHRSWHTEVEGHFHVFPEGKPYYFVLVKAL